MTATRHTLLIDWGDGHTATVKERRGESGSFSLRHAYRGRAERTYTVTVTVEGPDGNSIASLTLLYASRPQG